MKKFKSSKLLMPSLYCFSIFAAGYPINVNPINTGFTVIKQQVIIYTDNPREESGVCPSTTQSHSSGLLPQPLHTPADPPAADPSGIHAMRILP